MEAQPPRLGDLIDDYCPRCRLLLNHAVASLVEDKVAKVICQTCYSEHAYQHGEGGKKKSAGGRATLFDQVLAQAAPSPASILTPSQKRKGTAPARYISRHQSKPRGKT